MMNEFTYLHAEFTNYARFHPEWTVLVLQLTINSIRVQNGIFDVELLSAEKIDLEVLILVEAQEPLVEDAFDVVQNLLL